MEARSRPDADAVVLVSVVGRDGQLRQTLAVIRSDRRNASGVGVVDYEFVDPTMTADGYQVAVIFGNVRRTPPTGQ